MMAFLILFGICLLVLFFFSGILFLREKRKTSLFPQAAKGCGAPHCACARSGIRDAGGADPPPSCAGARGGSIPDNPNPFNSMGDKP